MGKRISFIFIIILLIVSYIGYEALSVSNKFSESDMIDAKQSIIQILPEFELTELGGRAYKTDESKSKNVFVHFWASWCGPCEKEFPHLVKMMDDQKDSSKTDFLFIAVNDDIPAIKKFLKRYPLPEYVKILIDTESVAKTLFGTYKLPETYLFDSSHNLIRKFPGAYNWEEVPFDSYIKPK